MQKLKFSTTINASKKKVWDTLLQDATYREWTRAFNPSGSWFEGDWSQGSRILFLGAGEHGGTAGMVSRIHENRPYEYVSIEHLGFVQDGKEDTTSDAVKAWTPAFENYTLKERDGRTEVLIDMDAGDEHAQMFTEMWPRALATLKELAEKEPG